MANAPVTIEKAGKFIALAEGIASRLWAMTLEANDAGAYFAVDFTHSYVQNYEVESDKKIGGGVHADAPALDGVVDADAGIDAGVIIEKSRDGALISTQVLRFRSNKALETP